MLTKIGRCKFFTSLFLIGLGILFWVTEYLALPRGYYFYQNDQWLGHGRPNYPPPIRAGNEKIVTPQTHQTCQLKNGRWGKIGLAPVAQCNLPTVDSGQPCRDIDECQGSCLVDLDDQEQSQLLRQKIAGRRLGHCSAWQIVVGCHARMVKGEVETICID